MIDTDDIQALEPLKERLCLDFTNTAGEHPSKPDDEFLTSYENLVEWSVFAGVVSQEGAQHLLAQAEQRPLDAEAALHYAVAVRETIFRVLSAAADERDPDAADMAGYNHILSRAMTHLRMAPGAAGLGWAWSVASDDLEQMLWPVVWSAAELLTSHDLHHLRLCASHECDWLFLDTSKNHSRRWCRMKNCGNRAKARTHYRRSRQSV
jgi:predicted RNA-binding Zn ribbon-like protein